MERAEERRRKERKKRPRLGREREKERKMDGRLRNGEEDGREEALKREKKMENGWACAAVYVNLQLALFEAFFFWAGLVESMDQGLAFEPLSLSLYKSMSIYVSVCQQ